MMILNRLFLFLLITLAFTNLNKISAQMSDPYKIIDHVKSVNNQVKDYIADVEIEVDVDFINIPVKHATIYFKSPDKVKFKSDDFFMIPKRSIHNASRNLLKGEYSAIYVGYEILNTKDHYVIKIIPLEKKPDIIMATWWVDTTHFLISKIESNTRKNGTYTINFTYNDPLISLPAMMIVSFEIEIMKIPLKFIGKSSGVDMKDLNSEGKQTGNVYLRFSNYKINTGIDNSFYDENNQQ